MPVCYTVASSNRERGFESRPLRFLYLGGLAEWEGTRLENDGLVNASGGSIPSPSDHFFPAGRPTGWAAVRKTVALRRVQVQVLPRGLLVR